MTQIDTIHKKRYLLFLAIWFSCFFVGCVPTKNLIYMQEPNTLQDKKQKSKEITITAPLYSYTISSGDMVGVEISTFSKGTINSISDNLNNKQASSADPLANGYLVDMKGNIQLPIIGEVQVVGLSILEAQEVIATKAAEYISNSIVKVRLLGFYITVLGEVGRPGRISVQMQSINIFEAISLAGDLVISSNYKNVRVVRIKNDKATTHYLNLNSNDLFSSEVFYLRPGDLIYVEPTKAKVTQNNLTALTVGTSILTTAFFIVNILVAVKIIK
jgi:polysaccharide export outer membrane protein